MLRDLPGRMQTILDHDSDSVNPLPPSACLLDPPDMTGLLHAAKRYVSSEF